MIPQSDCVYLFSCCSCSSTFLKLPLVNKKESKRNHALFQESPPQEKVAQFQEWLSQFPHSSITLSDEALRRENIYDDRGI